VYAELAEVQQGAAKSVLEAMFRYLLGGNWESHQNYCQDYPSPGRGLKLRPQEYAAWKIHT